MNEAGFSGREGTLSRDRILNALYGFLRPEFLNRVDEILVFNQLKKDDFKQIAHIMLEELSKALSEKAITLSYTDEVLETLAEKSFSLKFGARNLRRLIQTDVEDRAAELIISHYDTKIDALSVSVENGQICVNPFIPASL